MEQRLEVGLAGIGSGVGLAQVAPGGAQLQAAPDHHARKHGQVAVRCDVDIVGHHHFGAALGAQADRRRQPARTTRARQRERHAGRAHNRHALEINDRLAGHAHIAPGVQAQRGRLEIPVGIGAFAGAVGAVGDERFVFADEIKARGAALRIVQFHLVFGAQDPALARGQVQLQFVALVAVAKARHVDVALRGHFIFHLLEAGDVGREAGFAADQFDIALERDVAIGPPVDLFGFHIHGGIAFLDPQFVLGRLGERRHRGGGHERRQGIGPTLRRRRSCKPAHEKTGRNAMESDFLS